VSRDATVPLERTRTNPTHLVTNDAFATGGGAKALTGHVNGGF
jgi:hypothetical protein